MSPLLSHSGSFSKLGWFIFIVFLSFLLASLISIVIIVLFGLNPEELSETQNLIANGHIHLLKYLQIVQSVFLFIVPSVIFPFFITKNPGTWLQVKRRISWQTAILISLLMIFMFPVTNFFAEFNQTFHFPNFMENIYTWMLQKEEQLATLTKQFLKGNNTGELILNIFMIALIPAIGEELLFRGVLQKIFSNWTKNIHWGIFLSAFLFSAIHMQFLTFLPRFFLGAVFGYLLVWTHSLWAPILAHFLNNGIAVVISYLTQQQNIEKNIEQIGQSNNFFWTSLVNSFIIIIILFLIYKFETNTKKGEYKPNN